MTQLPAETKFTESLGDSRFISVDQDKDVTIGDFDYSGKRALLTAPHWVKLVEEMEEIDNAVARAATLKPSTSFTSVATGSFPSQRSFHSSTSVAGTRKVPRSTFDRL